MPIKTFALTAIIHGGARFETREQSGWAHLSEHMVFKGAGARNARELAEAIEHRGGTINASTGYEHTRFEVRGMRELLPLALEVVSDLMFRPVLDATELEREKKVIEQEISEAFDTPDDHVFDLLQAAVFGDHSLGRPILGTPESLAPARSESLRTYIGELYNPSETVVCISGAITPEDVDIISCYFGYADGLSLTSVTETPAFVSGHLHQKRKIEQSHMTLAFPGLNRYDDDLYALKLYGEILGGGMASRLFQEARENRGLAYSIDAFTTAFRDTGIMGVYAGCAPVDAVGLSELIISVMHDLAEAPLEAELERARAQFKTGLYLNDENAAHRAGTLSGQMLTYGRIFSLEEQSEKLDAVTIDDLKRVGRRVLSGGVASAIVGPPLRKDLPEALKSRLHVRTAV
ncbi:MAG: pitrilysin family protein [Asticcacaulis sp.]